MTVAAAEASAGRLHEVTHEIGLNTDAPEIVLSELTGAIHADLTVGTDVTKVKPLSANEWLCSPGVKLHGSGFIVTPAEAEHLGLGRREGLERHVRPYRNGRDLTARARGVMVIDLYGLEETEVRRCYPEVYQHLFRTVRTDREKQYKKSPTKDAAAYLECWWVFGKPRSELRAALEQLPRYIATVETSKHRVFQFLDASILPDNMLVCIAVSDAHELGVLSWRGNLAWTRMVGATLEDRPRYTKSLCFDPLPFPDASEEQRARIAAIAEELDLTRKEILAEHRDLTLTTLYNLREKLLKGDAFSSKEEDQRMRGRVDILSELHDRLDRVVTQAYGWPFDLSDAEIVERLVALNGERAAEERRGIVHWLRPDYQQKKAGVTAIERPEEQIEVLLPAAHASKPTFPSDPIGQTASVLAALRTGSHLAAEDIAVGYKQGRRLVPRIEATLQALTRLGHVSGRDGRYTLMKAA